MEPHDETIPRVAPPPMPRPARKPSLRRLLRKTKQHHNPGPEERHEALYRLAFRSTPNGVLLISPAGVVRQANRMAGVLLGTRRSDLEGQPIARLLGPRPAELILASAAESRQKGRHSEELEVIPLARTEFCLRVAVVPVTESDAFAGCTLLFCKDATELVRAQHTLVRELAFLSEVDELGRAISGRSDLAAIALSVCEAAVGHSSLEHAAVVYRSTPESDVKLAATTLGERLPRESFEARSIVRHVLATGEPIIGDALLPGEVSTWPSLEQTELRPCLALPVRAGDQVVAVLLGFGSDSYAPDEEESLRLNHLAMMMGTGLRGALLLQQLEERNEELGDTVRQLQEAERAREQFYRFLIHDLNKPLAAIIGTADRMGDHAGMTETLRPRTARISAAAHRLQDLVAKLLQYEQLRRGEVSLEMQDFDVVQVAREVLALFADHGKSVALTFNGLPAVAWSEIRPIELHADPVQLGRVLQNLVDNAVEHARTIVDLRLELQGDVLRVSVWNDGRAIKEEYREKVFSEYFRVPGTQRTGYGLGLPAVRRLVRAHGGTVWAEPAPDSKGTVFTFEIPVACDSGTDLHRTPPPSYVI